MSVSKSSARAAVGRLADDIKLRIMDTDTNSMVAASDACGCGNLLACAPCAIGVAVKVTTLGIQALSLVGRRSGGGEKTVK
ncbi:MAG: hypothetical protein KGH58_03460 [Candidatus Micrarchaeota archaeon]|nr:hypothetical protein [Candidatus Micrarchaeota archaeon]